MSLTLNTALDGLEPSGIRRFARLAAETPGCVSLTLGEPGEDTPDPIRECVAAELDRGVTHYPPNDGFGFLREAISDYMARRGETYAPEAVVVTGGATEALHSVLTALLNPGDELVVPTPAFGLYESLARLCRADVVALDTTPDRFQIGRDALAGAVTARTKAIVLTSPNNPTGCTLDAASLDAVAELARERDFYVVCDDVYEQLVYEETFQGFATRHPELADRTVVVNSLSKPYAMTGWRLGWFAAAPDVVASAAKVHQYSVSCQTAFTQRAAVTALASDTSAMRESYRARRDLVVRRLRGMGLYLVEPAGAFYAFPSVGRFGLDSETFCLRAIREAGVALVPGSFFGSPDHVRLSYSVELPQLELGLERLAGFVSALGDGLGYCS